MTPKLHRLPSGEWIDPAEIVHIQALDAYKATGLPGDRTDGMPRCRIVLRGGTYVIAECSDMAGAQHLADELGELANEARE